MARKARVEYQGAVYHVLDRGDRREAIFLDDGDRRRFLETLGEACGRTGWRVHAYVLMSNHYHLMIETPQANLVAGMRWFQTTWTMRFNRRHRLSGHLFQGRYKAVLVDAQEGGYFAVLSDYIHLNPIRARMIGLEERLFDYPWSSYPLYAARPGRPAWFEPRSVLGELGLEDTAAGRRAYAERMRGRAVEELTPGNEPAGRAELRRGWCLGGEGFRERMLRLLDAATEKLRLPRTSPRDASVQRDHGLDEAQRLLAEGLRCLGLEKDDLPGLRKGDPRKAALAVRIRMRTVVPNAWIAEQLQLGHVSRVTHCARTAPPELLRKLDLALGT
jgi:REP element-mobilizing transposase RayT